MSEALKEARKQMIDNSWASGSCEAPVVTLTDALGVLEKLEAALSRSSQESRQTKFTEEELQEHARQLNAIGMCAIDNPDSWGARKVAIDYIEKHFSPLNSREEYFCVECSAKLTANPMEGRSNSWCHFDGPKDCVLRGEFSSRYLSDRALINIQAESPSESTPAEGGGEFEKFVLELGGIYGLPEDFMRALPQPTLESWKLLIRDEARRQKGEREILEKFRTELCELKFGKPAAKLPAPEGMVRDADQCSCDVPHPAHTYGGRPMVLCKGIPKPDCDGSVVRSTGQCNSCLAYHMAHPTFESGTKGQK